MLFLAAMKPMAVKAVVVKPVVMNPVVTNIGKGAERIDLTLTAELY